jgi:hypothetical protein
MQLNLQSLLWLVCVVGAWCSGYYLQSPPTLRQETHYDATDPVVYTLTQGRCSWQIELTATISERSDEDVIVRMGQRDWRQQLGPSVMQPCMCSLTVKNRDLVRHVRTQSGDWWEMPIYAHGQHCGTFRIERDAEIVGEDGRLCRAYDMPMLGYTGANMGGWFRQ